jgi:RNA polymerase sigma factor (sigma-70 family)
VSCIAHRSAREITKEYCEDIAQDVVLNLFEKLRCGRMTERPAYLEALIGRIVQQRAIDYLRRHRRRRARNRLYMLGAEHDAPAWMRPDVEFEDAELEALHDRTINEVRQVRRRAFIMVRVDCTSYNAAGEDVGLTATAVHAHVTRARRAVRARLDAEAVAPPGVRAGRRIVRKPELN